MNFWQKSNAAKCNHFNISLLGNNNLHFFIFIGLKKCKTILTEPQINVTYSYNFSNIIKIYGIII